MSKNLFDDLRNDINDIESNIHVFKESEHNTRNALSIPYTGFGNSDYIFYSDLVLRNACIILDEIIDNILHDYKEEILSEREEDEELENNEYCYLVDGFDDFNDKGSFHEHIDSAMIWYMNLHDAVVIIENCTEEETDTGLWESLQPEDAIQSKAFFSFSNDVYWQVMNMIEEYT